MFEFYSELEEETEDFVGVEHVRVTKRYLQDWENPMEFYNEEEFRMRFRFHKQFLILCCLLSWRICPRPTTEDCHYHLSRSC